MNFFRHYMILKMVRKASCNFENGSKLENNEELNHKNMRTFLKITQITEKEIKRGITEKQITMNFFRHYLRHLI